jgi:hypothetical protein
MTQTKTKPRKRPKVETKLSPATKRAMLKYWAGLNYVPLREEAAEAGRKGGIEVTDEMVNRFLTWPVPDELLSDLCMTAPRLSLPRYGTNVMDAQQARAMLEYVFNINKQAA